MSSFHRPSHSRPQAACAFTLVELLVVLTVVALLAGLVFSVTARMRVSAQQAQCASNLRQIGLALNAYALENGNEYPETAHGDDEEPWFTQLHRFLPDVEKVAICPADPWGHQRFAAGQSSYILSEYVAVPLRDPFGRQRENFRNRLTLERPAQTMIVFPTADAIGVSRSRDHTHSRKWRSWGAVLTDIQPDRFRLGNGNSDRTDGRANYLYADGHVESHEAAWLKQQIEANRNPANPSQTP